MDCYQRYGDVPNHVTHRLEPIVQGTDVGRDTLRRNFIAKQENLIVRESIGLHAALVFPISLPGRRANDGVSFRWASARDEF